MRHLLFALVAFVATASDAQNWTVGVPVNMLITSYTFVGGCTPNADATFNFPASTALGVDHVAYITAVDPPGGSATIVPGIAGGAVGDSMVIDASVVRSLTVAAGTNTVTLEFRAVGTPTQAGDVHPCGGPSTWISNLMLCPEGLIASFNLTCTVQPGTIGIAEASSDPRFMLSQSGGRLSLAGARIVRFAIHDLMGHVVATGTTELANGVDLSHLATGSYVLHAVLADGTTHNERFALRT
jgi:hypothetical protein